MQAGVAHGTTFRYDLSKKADVFFFLDRVTAGRLVAGHCHRATSHNRHHRRCARYVRSGSFKQAGKEGANVKSFSGRIGSLTLAPARYRAKLVAVDDMGNPSRGKPVLSFTIVR